MIRQLQQENEQIVKVKNIYYLLCLNIYSSKKKYWVLKNEFASLPSSKTTNEFY